MWRRSAERQGGLCLLHGTAKAGAVPAFLQGGGSAQALAILLVVAHIMVMPPHVVIIGIPAPIMAIIRWQHSMNISFMASSMGIISHFMPVGVMVQVILHIIIAIGIAIMGIFIAGMPIIGMPIIGMFMGIMVCIGMVAFIDRLRI
jgi:hypothetical protein